MPLAEGDPELAPGRHGSRAQVVGELHVAVVQIQSHEVVGAVHPMAVVNDEAVRSRGFECDVQVEPSERRFGQAPIT